MAALIVSVLLAIVSCIFIKVFCSLFNQCCDKPAAGRFRKSRSVVVRLKPRLTTLLKALFGAGYEVILYLPVKRDKICRKTGDADDQILVCKRFFLRCAKLIRADHIELHLHTAELEIGAKQVFQLLCSLVTLYGSRREADIELVSVCKLKMRQLCSAPEVSCGAVLVKTLAR